MNSAEIKGCCKVRLHKICCMSEIFILLMSVALPLTASATTYYVNGTTGANADPGTSSSLAKKTIQAAVNGAPSDGTILVVAGRCLGISRIE